MKNKLLLLVVLFFTANGWSQEGLETVTQGEIDVEPIRYVEDSNYVYTIVDVPAEFPGGREELLKYLSSNIQYPPSAKTKKLSGKCYLQFIVNADGSITNTKVLRGVPECPQCDAEAFRVIKKMPKWKPGEVEGKPVRSRFIIPIIFSLN